MYIQGLSALALKSCLPKTFVLSKKGQKVLNMNSNHMFSYFFAFATKNCFFLLVLRFEFCLRNFEQKFALMGRYP